MKRNTKNRILSLLFALILSVSLAAAPAAVLAEESGYTGCGDISGTYTYVSNESPVSAETDEYRYNDGWFSGSSFELNRQLATLSAIAAVTSASYYTDAQEKDKTQNSKNIEAFLKDIGFENVEANMEYNLENLPLSAGVCIGQKKVTFDGKEYTLLAVIPRSAGYKQEWAGNFQVDNANDTHYGFKQARDEILRFLRSYVQKYSVSGDVKIWIAGHSRGAALANMTAAFLASGTDYLGSGVTVTPENIYAYTFATPRTVITDEDGTVIKGEFLYVGASRSGRYENRDTAGESYSYSGSDADAELDPGAGVYDCIHNCVPDYDIFTLVPPGAWGYGYFGITYNVTDGEASTKEKMLGFLEDVSAFAWGRYTDDGDSDDFCWMTVDSDTLSIVPDTEAGKVSQAQMYDMWLSALARLAGTPGAYAATDEDGTGYQKALMAIAGIYGMAIDPFAAGFLSDTETVIKGAALAYLDYAANRIAVEKSVSGDEALMIAVEGLLSFITGEVIDHGTFTVDGALYILCKYLADHGTPVNDESGNFDRIDFDSVPAGMLYDALKGVTDMFSDKDNEYNILWKTVIVPGAYGSSETNPNAESAYTARQLRYMFLPAALTDEALKAKITEILAPVSEGADYGTKPASVLLGALLPALLGDSATPGAAADVYLAQAVANGTKAALESGRYEVGSEFYGDLASYGADLVKNISLVRNMILFALCDTPGKSFSTEYCIESAATFIGNTSRLALAHYNEVYIAWMKAQDPAYAPDAGHSFEHHDAIPAGCGSQGQYEYWYCEKCGEYFLDSAGKTAAAGPEDLVIPALTHDWSDWKVETGSDSGTPGLEKRVCSHCEDSETRPFSYESDWDSVVKWSIDDVKSLEVSFRRTEADEATFTNFTGLVIDGTDVPASAYTAVAGSVKITVSPAYLRSLGVGGHTLTAVFTDGTAQVRFRVVDVSENPITGVNDPLALTVILGAFTLMIMAAIYRRKRSEQQKN